MDIKNAFNDTVVVVMKRSL